MKNIEVKYNKPILVTKKQANLILKDFSGFVAYREDESTGNYYIKVWIMSVAKHIEKIIAQNTA